MEQPINQLHQKGRKTNRGRFFMDQIIKIIEKSEYPQKLKRHKHAAIIVKGGKIIGVGINSMKPHPMALPRNIMNTGERTLDEIYTIHAEMAAIRSVKNKENLKGTTIFVGRLSDCWGETLSCPCPICTFYLKKYGIQRAIYSTNDGHWFEARIS